VVSAHDITYNYGRMHCACTKWRNGRTSTSGLKSDVTIMFLDYDFLSDAQISAIRVHFNADIGLLNICVGHGSSSVEITGTGDGCGDSTKFYCSVIFVQRLTCRTTYDVSRSITVTSCPVHVPKQHDGSTDCDV